MNSDYQINLCCEHDCLGERWWAFVLRRDHTEVKVGPFSKAERARQEAVRVAERGPRERR